MCSGVLSADEEVLLARVAGPLKLSAADLVLLDELTALIRPLTSSQMFGHVVLDEAQDVSPMQCRAIARRTALGSLTVLGDLAQGRRRGRPRTGRRRCCISDVPRRNTPR